MTKTLKLGMVMLIVGLTSMAFVAPKATTYNVDTNATKLTWKAEKVTGSHEGTVNVASGNLNFEGEKLTGGSFEIDMTSIKCTDLQGDMAGKLEGHLKSADFFNTAKHAKCTFKITKAFARNTSGSYRIIGDLTVKSITKEIKFNADIKSKDNKKMANAKITIDRTDYDVRYGSGSFFDNLGDKTIYDEFTINLALVAGK